MLVAVPFVVAIDAMAPTVSVPLAALMKLVSAIVSMSESFRIRPVLVKLLPEMETVPIRVPSLAMVPALESAPVSVIVRLPAPTSKVPAVSVNPVRASDPRSSTKAAGSLRVSVLAVAVVPADTVMVSDAEPEMVALVDAVGAPPVQLPSTPHVPLPEDQVVEPLIGYPRT